MSLSLAFFHGIRWYSTVFDGIRRDSTGFDRIRRDSTGFDGIRRDSIRQDSTRFDGTGDDIGLHELTRKIIGILYVLYHDLISNCAVSV